ncbi:MAG: hypothetical protein KZQ99_18310 [Candidatus Thiodiazotropha sp. (ex Dulcina madagascariensis)]|nr:hypothetical protein [Candidatus Thiodiazotropha sp. (ex Dulcina madagascariensis)]
MNEISGMDAMASSPRAKGTREAIVKPLVSEKEMTGVRLRGQTRGLLQKPPKALSASETALLNRLLLEDLYHPHLVRRLDKGLVRFPFIASETPSAVLKAVMGHEALCVDCRFELKRIDSGAGNPDGVAQALNKATMTKSTAEAFLKHLRASIPALHTEDELKALTPVASVKFDEPFYVKAAKPVRPVLDLILSRAAAEGQTGLEAAEEEAMIKSGFNPVLKPPRVE